MADQPVNDPQAAKPPPESPASGRQGEASGAAAKKKEGGGEERAKEKASRGVGSPLTDLFLQETGEIRQDLIEIAAMDVERDRYHEARLEKEKADKRETFYSDLIYTLTHLRYDEAEARVLWVNLLTHKYETSYRLGRNVGIRVAALDYFRNVLGALDDVKIIDASAYIETAQLAITDGLTGVFNHRYLQDRLLRDVHRIREEGGCLSLMMLDIDHFKLYNDFNGHIAGDVALKEVGRLLRRNLKREDLVARYGGEEFAVILMGLDRSPAMAVAERMRLLVEQTPFPNARVLPSERFTISIGLAECPGDAEERGELIAAADRALYMAKRNGRNRVEVAPQDSRREQRRKLNCKVRFRLAEAPPEAPWAEAQALNVSARGMCILADGAVASGQLLRLIIEGLPEGERLLGRTVWCLPRPGGLVQAGIQFVNVKPELAAQLEALPGA